MARPPASPVSAKRVFLGLGSNLGDREEALREAYRRLEVLLSVPRISPIYESEPMYVTDQPLFLNAVCAGFTELPPLDLLRETQLVESALGRVRSSAKGPRTIDVDILLYEGVHLVEDSLSIPHPGIRERPFVLMPLLDLEPALCDPLTGTAYRRYLEGLDTGTVRLHSPV
jgi:2-amino-4-hydroxy-6-hydroxymethyldihydropteridine diphosphokinase